MTRRKRETSEDEKVLFRETFRDVRPHVAPAAKKPAAKKEPKEATQKEPKSVPRLHTAGLDGRTAERLRRGQLEPQSRLDLHGMTEAAAHRALQRFLRVAHTQGARLVLVVTGKGLKPPGDDEPFDLELHMRSRGVLRTMVPRWLKEAALAPLVADVRTAHRRHGGGGALYIYLRKSV
jgi:DNA-nicking Smr family endonuclease